MRKGIDRQCVSAGSFYFFVKERCVMNDNRYSNPAKLHWHPDISCPACGEEVNSWDKRCSRALGYKAIFCEACISKEYGINIEELRDTMKEHFGLIPCPGI